jgi:hypothetical protein
MNTILDQWETFQRDVISNYAGEFQVREMKLAFYAGFQAMVTMQAELIANDLSYEEGIALMEQWAEEINSFAREL